MSNNKRDAAYHGGELPEPPHNRVPDGQTVLTTDKPKKKKRIFMWFFITVQLVFIFWIWSASVAGSQEAARLAIENADSGDAYAAGTAIGVGLVLIFWAIVDFLLVITWAVVKLARR